MVKVSVESADTPLKIIGSGEKSFEIWGGRMAVKVSTADPPGPEFSPVCVEDTKPLILVWGPAVSAVMVIPDRVQFAPAASVPPLKSIWSGAVVDNKPPQVAVGAVVVTVKPSGSVSLKAIPLSTAKGLGLLMVKESVDVPPTGTGSGAKDLLSVGYSGRPQPRIYTLSRTIVGAVPVGFAPISFTRKVVVALPVLAATAVFPEYHTAGLCETGLSSRSGTAPKPPPSASDQI